jgi:hypothetical protein
LLLYDTHSIHSEIHWLAFGMEAEDGRGGRSASPFSVVVVVVHPASRAAAIPAFFYFYFPAFSYGFPPSGSDNYDPKESFPCAVIIYLMTPKLQRFARQPLSATRYTAGRP